MPARAAIAAGAGAESGGRRWRRRHDRPPDEGRPRRGGASDTCFLRAAGNPPGKPLKMRDSRPERLWSRKLWTHKIWRRGSSRLLCRSEPVFADAEKRIDTLQSAREWRRKPLEELDSRLEIVRPRKFRPTRSGAGGLAGRGRRARRRLR